MSVRTLFAVAWLLAACVANGEGSCGEAGLCCHGRNGSCVAFDHADDPRSRRGCYCDHACIGVGDCCPDFERVCQVADCEVSPWDPWSECSSECGPGTMTRRRRVLRSPSNGGRLCPELLQMRSCSGNRCHGKNHVKANREAAMILAATFSDTRHLYAERDIRNNLRLRYRKDPDEEKSKEYCVSFEIIKVHKICENLGNDVSSKLAVGTRVCTACETAAMRKHLGYQCQGHGTQYHKTRFILLDFPQCHGRWQRLEETEKCKCNGTVPDFIFV